MRLSPCGLASQCWYLVSLWYGYLCARFLMEGVHMCVACVCSRVCLSRCRSQRLRNCVCMHLCAEEIDKQVDCRHLGWATNFILSTRLLHTLNIGCLRLYLLVTGMAAHLGSLSVRHNVHELHRQLPECYCGQHLIHIPAQAECSMDEAPCRRPQRPLHCHFTSGVQCMR